jgi:hypothetical protein
MLVAGRLQSMKLVRWKKEAAVLAEAVTEAAVEAVAVLGATVADAVDVVAAADEIVIEEIEADAVEIVGKRHKWPIENEG